MRSILASRLSAEATAQSASYLSRALRLSSTARAMRSICACSASSICLLTALDWAKTCCWASWRAFRSAKRQSTNRGMGPESASSSSSIILINKACCHLGALGSFEWPRGPAVLSGGRLGLICERPLCQRASPCVSLKLKDAPRAISASPQI